LRKSNLGPECEEYFEELMQEQKDVVTVVRKNCLNILCDCYIRNSHNKCLVTVFIKITSFYTFVSLFYTNRETSFNDISFIIKTISGFAETALKKE